MLAGLLWLPSHALAGTWLPTQTVTQKRASLEATALSTNPDGNGAIAWTVDQRDKVAEYEHSELNIRLISAAKGLLPTRRLLSKTSRTLASSSQIAPLALGLSQSGDAPVFSGKLNEKQGIFLPISFSCLQTTDACLQKQGLVVKGLDPESVLGLLANPTGGWLVPFIPYDDYEDLYVLPISSSGTIGSRSKLRGNISDLDSEVMPAASFDASANLHLLYVRAGRLNLLTRLPSGQIKGPQVLASTNCPSDENDCGFYEPVIAADGSGGLVAAWCEQSRSGNTRVRVVTSQQDQQFGQPVTVGQSQACAWGPRLAVSAGG